MDKTAAGHQTPHFNVLSEGQCQELYNAALECLERIGVIVHNEEGRQLLENAGAYVDGNLVKIPGSIIQRALEQAPNSFELWDRDGESFFPGSTVSDSVRPRPNLYLFQ